jgi:hypothetical protein
MNEWCSTGKLFGAINESSAIHSLGMWLRLFACLGEGMDPLTKVTVLLLPSRIAHQAANRGCRRSSIGD